MHYFHSKPWWSLLCKSNCHDESLLPSSRGKHRKPNISESTQGLSHTDDTGKRTSDQCWSAWRTLSSGRIKTISKRFRIPISITSDVSQQTLFCNIQRTWCSEPNPPPQIRSSFWLVYLVSSLCQSNLLLFEVWKGIHVEDVKNHPCKGTKCRACGQRGLCSPGMPKRCDQRFLTFNGNEATSHCQRSHCQR